MPIQDLENLLQGITKKSTSRRIPRDQLGISEPSMVEPEPQTKGESMVSEFRSGLPTIQEQPFKERAKLAAKGIGGAVSSVFEKAAEGFGDLGSLIGVATSGVDLTPEQKSQILEDIEVQKKTQEYKDFISKKGAEFGFVSSFGIPSATLAKAPKAASVLGKAAIGAAAGAEAIGLQKIGLEGELPTAGELGAGATVGAALPLAGPALAKGKQFLGKTAPAKLLKSALKLTPTQKNKLQQITVGGDEIQDLINKGLSPEEIAAQEGSTVFDWLVERGYSGSPKEIAARLRIDSNKAIQVKKELLSKVPGIYKDITGVSAPSKILNGLIETLQDVPGKEQELAKAKGLLNKLQTQGLDFTELDNVKTFFDSNSNIFKKAGFANVKEGAKAEGLANLRRDLKLFLEKEASDIGDLKAINNEISATRATSEAIAERAIGAGGNAVLGLTDIIIGAGAGGAEFGRSQDPIKALQVAAGVTIGKRLLTNPNFQTALAKVLQKTFNDGEAGIIIRALQGKGDDISLPLKNKLNDVFKNIVKESPEFADDLTLKPVTTTFKQDVDLPFNKAGTAKSALVAEAKKFSNPVDFRNRINKDLRNKLSEMNVRSQEQYNNFWINSGASNIERKLESLNPTGSVFVNYDPSFRATAKLGKDIVTLDKTMKRSPDDIITIFRGVPSGGKAINPGDFITTNKDLALSYSGNGNIISKKVKLSDILDDIKSPLGEEYIYRP